MTERALTIRLSEEQYQALRRRAFERETKMSDEIRAALNLLMSPRPEDPRIRRVVGLLCQIRTNAGNQPFIVRDSVGRRLDDVLHAIRQGEHDGLFELGDKTDD